MGVKLKVACVEIATRRAWHGSTGNVGAVKLQPVTSGSDENKAFYDATPSGQLEFATINQKALEQFEVGAEYYVTIERAEPATA